jgi:signal transduction histidine kinase/ligand-binding sensor domain-containing protein/DNA-binding response OmpR family regulator
LIRTSVIASIILGLLLHTTLSFGQYHRVKFRRLSTVNGLSQSNVTCLLQDSTGFIWLGTQDGLNRYDGYQFTVFRYDPADSASIPNNYIKGLAEGEGGNLWVATWGGGLCRFDQSKGKFIPFNRGKPVNAQIPDNFINCLTQDGRGNLWVGTENHGALLIRASDGKILAHPIGDDNNVTRVLVDHKGQVWLGTRRGGLMRYDGSADLKVYRHHQVESFCLASDHVSALFEDSQNRLWVGTGGGGLDLMLSPAGAFRHFQHSHRAGSLSNDMVFSIGEDADHTLWVGTENGGLNLLPEGAESFYHLAQDDIDTYTLSNNSIYSIFRDRNNNMWVGTYSGGVNLFNRDMEAFLLYRHNTESTSLSNNNVLDFWGTPGKVWIGTDGGGLNILDEPSGRFRRILHHTEGPKTIGNDYVLSVQGDSKGTIWVGTVAEGLSILDTQGRVVRSFRHSASDPNSLSGNNICALALDHRGSMWIATYGTGLDRYDAPANRFEHFFHEGSAGISSNRIQKILGDSHGLVWIGTFDKGVDVWNPQNRTFLHYVHDSARNSVSNNAINDMLEDQSGNIWIATNYGLNRWDRRSGQFRTFLSKDGLGGNIIHALLEDSRGHLWISTDKGLSSFDPSSSTARNFSAAYGIQPGEFKAHAAWKSPDGMMYFGGTGGFTAFQPDSLKGYAFDPPLVLTKFSLFNKEVIPDGGDGDAGYIRETAGGPEAITLPYDHSVLTFDFASLNYTTADRKHYAYRLQGFEQNWNETGTRHSVTYTNLDPDKYLLQVRGFNNSGVWSDKLLTLRLEILPPWWSTWWFRVGMLFLGIALIYGIIALRVRIIHDQKRVLEKQVLERTHQLAEASKKEREANEAKSIFLAMMSHEIRTPLNGIIGMSSLLSESELAKEQQDYVQTIQHSGETLLSVINDILDFSKIEAGHMELEDRDFPLDVCVEEVLELFSPRASEAGIDLVCDMDEQVPRVIRGDMIRLRQILTNLVSNAVKFTRKGEVFLHVGVAKEWAGGALDLAFTVRDTGIGIPEDKLHRLFKAFSQVDASTTRQYGGTGLGLIICEKLVTLMGGKISVTSKEEEGTVFQFTIRTRKAEAWSGEPAPTEGADASVLAGKRVLVIDDNDTNLHILEKQLSKWGMIATSVLSGKEALSLIRQGVAVDLVITDMQMPGMNGKEVGTALSRALPRTPVILLSSTADNIFPEKEKLFKAVLHKPVRNQLLLNALLESFHPTGGKVEVAPKGKQLDPGFATEYPLRILVAEDNPVNQKLVEHILQKLGYAPDKAFNGQEAIDKSAAGNYDVILMDVSMPEVDGLQATRLIRLRDGNQPAIIAMTANAMEGDRQACLDAGMNDYVSKPLQLDQLLQSLKKYSTPA